MAKYRYENKYIIDKKVGDLLKIQLRSLLKLDPHSLSDTLSYEIRSLYFDDLDNCAYYEKIDGNEYRKKYRMRMYNLNESMIKLECKYKDENMTFKKSCNLNKKNSLSIIEKDLDAVKLKDEFFEQFKNDCRLHRLVPRVLVDYSRLAFVYPYSDVRITFDENLKSGGNSIDFFNPEVCTIPIYEKDLLVLEVKYNEELPLFIQTILNSYNLTSSAVSKFVLCDELKEDV